MSEPYSPPSPVAALAAVFFLFAAPAYAGCAGSVQTGHGDSALALAQRCGTTVQQLRLANPSIDMNRPLGGQIVRVPGQAPPSYIPDAAKRGVAPAPVPLTPFGQSPAYRRHSRSLIQKSALKSGETYTVRRGDTLGGLARRAGVPLAALLAANPGVDPRALAVGQRIVLPEAE